MVRSFTPRRSRRTSSSCNLDGIEAAALADIVGDYPEVEAVFNGVVFADAANEGVVLSGSIDGERVHVFCGIVVHLNARSLRQNDAGLLGGDLVGRFNID